MRMILALASLLVATLAVAPLVFVSWTLDFDVGPGEWIAIILLVAGYLETQAESQ